MNRLGLAPFLLAPFVVASGAHAVSPKYWIHDVADEFGKGEATKADVAYWISGTATADPLPESVADDMRERLVQG